MINAMLPTIRNLIKKTVTDSVDSAIVIPDRKFVKLKTGQDTGASIDWYTLAHAWPIGILRLRVASARGLHGSDISIRSRKGTSDPYCVVRVGRMSERTSKVYRTINPEWPADEWNDFLVYSSRQTIRLQVFDSDRGSHDETLGTMPSRTVYEFLHECSRQRRHIGHCTLRIRRARNLRAGDISGASDPLVNVTIGNYWKATSVVPRTVNPVWNERMTFPVCSLDDDLVLEVRDKDFIGSESLGKAVRKLSSLVKNGQSTRNIGVSAKLEDTTTGTVDFDFRYVVADEDESSDSEDEEAATTLVVEKELDVSHVRGMREGARSFITIHAQWRSLISQRPLWLPWPEEAQAMANGLPIGHLTLTINRATGLGAADDHVCSPLMVITLGEGTNYTSVIPESRDPEWNEDFSLQIFSLEDLLLLRVHDKDEAGETLGVMKVKVRHLLTHHSREAQVRRPLLGGSGDVEFFFRYRTITDREREEFQQHVEAEALRHASDQGGPAASSFWGSSSRLEGMSAIPGFSFASQASHRSILYHWREKVGKIVDSKVVTGLVNLIVFIDVVCTCLVLVGAIEETPTWLDLTINLLLALENFSRLFHLGIHKFVRSPMCVFEFCVVCISLFFLLVASTFPLDPSFLRALRPVLRGVKVVKTVVTLHNRVAHREVFENKKPAVAILSVAFHGVKGFPPGFMGMFVRTTLYNKKGQKVPGAGHMTKKSKVSGKTGLEVPDVDAKLQETIHRMVFFAGMTREKVAHLVKLPRDVVDQVILAQADIPCKFDQSTIVLLPDVLYTTVEFAILDERKQQQGVFCLRIADFIHRRPTLTDRAMFEINLDPDRRLDIARQTGSDPAMLATFLCLTLKLRYLDHALGFDEWVQDGSIREHDAASPGQLLETPLDVEREPLIVTQPRSTGLRCAVGEGPEEVMVSRRAAKLDSKNFLEVT
mmetsp:Transcript_54526/g.125129  ORF Transcript_54526/g.125129 Transcript_54526/m.125129 type:complete len:939 (+) Transcript_54526:131-2947(+)